MKPKWYLVIAITIIVITSLAWSSIFHTFPISEKTGDWSNFGSYIGGIVGPLLSFVSILLVIETITRTQKNHEEQIKLLSQEQTYSKFNDLCNYLTTQLNNGPLNSDSVFYQELIELIRVNVIFDSRHAGNTSLARKHALTLEAAELNLKKLIIDIDDLVLIIRTMMKFIFTKSIDDKELMTNIIELKMTKEQRLIIYVLIRMNYPQDEDLINKHWPTFCTYPWS
ncbi:hypothetical protein [Pectobacterium aroidearum]|uniref:hypothetical protein n=1 Tax=Pectobacterium aroidearum TaxID=1201031 RepID=UPI0015DF8957|nr:hypothetical protein [Pectobacterium aroidearum]MBA0203966.1 hypothetical protein [Pectobacterium aroidearum]